jgi:poly-gamma-glutamate capsule biosynthesis protein CapA/YwtB (metallophosphatase superfamily)
MRGKHRRRRPPPGPISLSAVMVGVLAVSLATPRQAEAPERSERRRARSAPSAPAPRRPEAPRRFTIAATGDILIHESLWERAARLGSARSEEYDFRPMFRRVRDTLAGADLALCHLETPVTADGSVSSYPVFAAPIEITDAIAHAGYDSCSTASNHSLDGGAPGIDATLDSLDRSGVAHAGTARSRPESRRITMLDVEGAAVAQLSYSFGFNGFTPEHDWQANAIEVARILDDARRARDRGSDFTVVSLHWGVEPITTPTAFQTQVAERLTRSPFVDAIVGHHAHVVQPIERVNGKVVAYGMGNFLSGMRPSDMWPDGVEDGVIVLLRVERRGDAYRVTRVRAVPTTVEYGTWRILPSA